MSQADFNFGTRSRVKVDIDGVEREVVNLKGAVLSVESIGPESLEVLLHPEASPQFKSFRFNGKSPIREMDYASVGIILGEKQEELREALYIILEDRAGIYPEEKHRAYKRGYIQNEADDRKLGIFYED